MNARNSWSAKVDRKGGEKGAGAEIAVDDLLDARFDEEGRLAQIGRGGHQRVTEKLDPRPPSMSPEELERAVQKLASGLEAIERQSTTQAASETGRAESGGRDFVTYSLDRLESRLEALSQRLAQRASTEPAPEPAPTQSSATRRAPLAADPSLAVEQKPTPAPDAAAQRRSEAARALREAEAAAEQRRRAEALEAQRRAEAAEASRRAEAAEEEDARRRVEAAEAERRALNQSLELKRHFAALEARVEELQKGADQNRIEPVRGELMGLLRQIEDVKRNGGTVVDTVEQVQVRLDDVETKVAAARNLAGNRIGDLQDKLSGLSDRLDEFEVEVPGFDAVRENQSAILERFDRMEGMVQHLAPSDQLTDRIDALRRQMQTIASQQEVARIERQIQELSERFESLPAELSDAATLERMEAQLSSLSSELSDARRHREAGTARLDSRLAEIAAGLKAIGEANYTPDMTGVEERLSDISTRIEDSHRSSSDRLSRLDQRLSSLATAMQEEEDDASADILASLNRRMEALSDAIEAQDARGARRDLEGLDRKIDQLANALADHADRLTPPQLAPLEDQLERMQHHLEETVRKSQTSTAQFGPFSQKLQEIADRLNRLGDGTEQPELVARLASIEERLSSFSGRSPDTRALHTQLESIVSRLELLKGRSIDPARLTELFDRVDSAMRSGGGSDDRLERIEKKIEQSAVPVERLERLERSIAESVRAGVGDEIFESRIAESALAGVAEQRFARLEKLLSDDSRAAPAEERLARIENLLLAEPRSGPADDRLARIEQLLDRAGTSASSVDGERFARLENKLEEIGRSFGTSAGAGASGGEGLTQEDIADLSTDIVALRRELRSLPGLGEGEGNLGAVLKTVAARLERISDDPPVTAPVLESQIERITQLLDDPSHSRFALAHIETSLKSIEQRLDDTRRALLFRTSEESVSESGGQFETVAGLARALSDDVTVLKSATEASEKKTKDALEAVQDTLQAVVMRMAFLERDADLASATAEVATPTARRLPEPSLAEPVRAKLPPVKSAILPDPEWQSTSPEIHPPVAPAKPEVTSGGLFGRLTSSQLLKRATGGRAESFSPDEEADDFSDLPLEPGTDSPLDSALTGAPSSDTARMSGSRQGRRALLGLGGAREPAVAYTPAEPEVEDDFLNAARRAAQAATADADEEAGTARVGARRMRAVLGGMLAVAIAFAAVQILRNQMGAGEPELAGGPASPLVIEELAPVVAVAPAPQPATLQPVAAPPAILPAAKPSDDAAPSERILSGFGEEAPAADAARLSPADGARAARDSAPAVDDDVGSVASIELAPTPSPLETPTMAIDPNAAILPLEFGPTGLREAAISGNPTAAFEVAARFAEGHGVGQDMAEAVEWYERAAESGLAPAQYRLGSIFEKGLGVPQDLPAAQRWYTRAADAGNVKAMHNLAVLYAEGAGGEPDLERAAVLFRQAAEHGVRDSQFNLAILHARGLGVEQDMIEAYRWFAIAASSGDAESAKRRDIIAAALLPDDLATAEAAAEAFQPLPLIAEANDVMTPAGGWGEDSTSVELDTTTDLVALVQMLLAEQGYDPGPSDGLLGQRTVQAITAFQEELGLPRTGEIDAGLVAALQVPSS